ncbi:MAG: hypothetical protein JO306_12915, partial [Gemmatimonadetes bacterium]|nr:hypothetical protein [Gemmatimonadota bacterium]
MLLFQEAQTAAHGAAEVLGAHGNGFTPVVPWLILGLPLLGFVLNGLFSVIAARRALPKLPPVGDPSYDHAHEDEVHAAAHAPAMAHAGAGVSEQEGHDAGTDPHPVDAAHAHDAHALHDDAHG